MGGQEGGRGEAGEGGKLKVDSSSSAVPSVWPQTGRIHKGGQDCHEVQPGTPCSPINALQGHEMHPGGLTASVKSRL